MASRRRGRPTSPQSVRTSGWGVGALRFPGAGAPGAASRRRGAQERVDWSPLGIWRRLDDGWRLALILLLAQRVVLGFVGMLAMRLAGDAGIGGEYGALIIRGGEPWSLLLSSWQRWDGLRYQMIAEVGYKAGELTTNFYPLYPLLSKIVSIPLGGHIVWAELVVSSIFFVIAMRLLYGLTLHLAQSFLNARSAAYAADGTDERGRARGRALIPAGPPRAAVYTATLTVLLVALFPTGFFFLAPFTESLFLALCLGTLLLAARGQWWLAGALGFFAALSRANGAALALPLIFMYLRDAGVWAWLRRGGGRPPSLAAVATLLPLAGAATWTAYLSLVVGDGRRGMITRFLQEFGGTSLRQVEARPATQPRSWEIVAPWDALTASIANIAEGLSGTVHVLPGGASQSLVGVEVLNLVSLLVCCALAVLVWRWLPIEHSLFLWPNLIVLITRRMEFQPLLSTGRYVLVLYPCFIVAALLFARRPRLAIPWLVATALLQIVLLTYYVRWRFVA